MFSNYKNVFSTEYEVIWNFIFNCLRCLQDGKERKNFISKNIFNAF